MGTADTTMGGSREVFPETLWSTILSSPASPQRDARLNDLLSRYWRPVYRFIRCSAGSSSEDAKDLTQAFFCHVVESDLVAKYAPDRGRFRSFLKGSVRKFVAEARRDSRRLKRGGGRAPVTLDAGSMAELEADRERTGPEEAFDRQWAREVLAEAVKQLRARLVAEGRELYWKVYDRYELHPPADGRVSYQDVAQALGIGVYDVQNHLGHVRERLHQCLLEGVTSYVTSREDLALEMKELFSG